MAKASGEDELGGVNGMEMKFTPEEVMEICRVCGDTIASCEG